MNAPWMDIGRKASGAALLAMALGGCVIATDSRPRAADSVADSGAAAFCQQSSDGKMVACGGKATFCEQSSDGRKVACGGQASHCEVSTDGRATACGAGARAA